MQPKKILICYSRAGGGHESMAHIIAHGLKNHHLELLDIGSSNQLLSHVLSSGYVWLTEKTPWLWYILSIIWKTFLGMYLTKTLTQWSIRSKLFRYIANFKPDMIISTYYFINHIAKNKYPHIKTCTVVSDIFAVQPIWFYDTTETYIVMSKQSERLALSSGVPQGNIFLCDPIYHEKYDTPVTDLQIKQCLSKLNIPHPTYPSLLVIGGGNSIPNGYRLIKKLISMENPCDLYIVCGRNVALKKKLEKLRTALHPDTSHRIHIMGFTIHVRELISLCDIIISKAGPGIMLEALSLKRPLFLYHYIWEQEKPNMKFIVDNRFGIYESNLEKLIHTINTTLKDPATLQQYQIKLSEYSLHNGQAEMITYLESRIYP